MKFENIKLIGLDLDGTLLKDDKTIDEKTTFELNKLHKKGIFIVPITGRPLSGVDETVRNINGVDYLITSNGSNIVKNSNSKILFHSPLDNKTALEIISIIEKEDCLFEIFSNHFGYCEENVYSYFRATYTGTPLGNYIFKSRKCVPSLKSIFFNGKMMIDEIFIICQNKEQRNKISKKLIQFNDIQLCFLTDNLMEITSKGTDKGSALLTLCDFLKIPIKDTLAFGDGENDLQFLNEAGISVAMGNATKKVKEKADIITLTNEENGVLHILKQI